MAQESPLSATGSLSEAQYEALAHPQAPDGLVGHPDDAAPVFTSGGQISVRANLRGVLRGFPWGSGVTTTSYTPSLTGGNRTDLVVLRLDRATGYSVGTDLRPGTPGAGAPAPVTGTGPTDVYEIPLAEVDIVGGALGAVRRRAWYVGDDGQILCKVATRPPHAAGRRIREVDTGRTYESTGTAWVVLLDDSGMTTLPLGGIWAASRNVLYRRNGDVHLSLTISRPGGDLTAASTVSVGTIPDGFRPPYNFDAVGMTLSPVGLGTVSVLSSGAVSFRPMAGLNAGASAVISPLSWPVA